MYPINTGSYYKIYYTPYSDIKTTECRYYAQIISLIVRTTPLKFFLNIYNYNMLISY